MTEPNVAGWLESSLAPTVERAVAAFPLDLRTRAEPALARVAHEAYQFGRAEAIRGLLTTDQAAAQLRLHPNRVRVLARSRGVGWQVGRGVWLFQPSDIEAMRDRRPGRRPKATQKEQP